MQSQMLEARQRREAKRIRKVLEDERALRECQRLLAEEAVEKAAAHERQRQEMLQVSRDLQEQARLKKIAKKEDEEHEKRLVKEYEELMDKQDAARAARLQAMADDQARRMALNSGVQQAQQARDDAMAARIERHWKEKYQADDAKYKADCLERKRRMEECHAQRLQQSAHDEELLRQYHTEERRRVSEMAAQFREAVAKDKDAAAAAKVKRKDNQQELIAQICEVRTRLPVDMSQTERDMNITELTLGASIQ